MVRRRTSTVPGESASVPLLGRLTSRGGSRGGGEAGRGGSHSTGGATSSASRCAVSADWRWGRITRPMGCSVAARRSTRMVRSLAATGSVVITAQRAAKAGGSEAGSPPKSTRRAMNGSAVASARSCGSSGSSVTRIVSDQAHDPAAARAARQSAGASSPRTGRTSPASSGTSHVPSASSPTGITTGRNGEHGSYSLSASWPTRHPVPSAVWTKPSGGSPGSACLNMKVTPEGETQIARTRGREPRPSRATASMQLAASNEWRAGVPAKRSSNVAASSAPSDGCRIGSPTNRSLSRRRRPARRAKAAQATEPRPRASSSGRCPGGCGCGDVRDRSRSWASAGRRRRHPSRSWSGSTKRDPPPTSRPRLSAASDVQSAPSPSASCAMPQSESPCRTA